MLSTLKQVLGLLILGFAVMGFVAVPLEGKTGLEHARHFWAQPETQDAAQTLKAGVSEAATELEAEMNRPSDISSAASLRKHETVLKELMLKDSALEEQELTAQDLTAQ